jgi:hypothetical protein
MLNMWPRREGLSKPRKAKGKLLGDVEDQRKNAPNC